MGFTTCKHGVPSLQWRKQRAMGRSVFPCPECEAERECDAARKRDEAPCPTCRRHAPCACQLELAGIPAGGSC